MKRIFLLIIAATFFTFSAGIVRANDIFTDPLADAADQFFLVSPTANQKVKNSVVISVRTFDDEQTAIPTTIEIWDSASCRSTKVGTIMSTNFVSNASVNNDINWNTKANVGAAPLNDGDYCLKVCLTLKNGANNYTACNGRRVRVLNNNRIPTITSLPPQLSIYENDAWQYDVNATDPDNDPITYRLVQTASFLSIDPSTGLITRNGGVSFPNGVTRLDYTIIVAADDNFAGAATQQFVLSILKRPPPPPVNPPTQPTPEPEVTNTAAQITFITPTENQIFKGADNKITWKIVDPDGLAEGYLLFAKEESNPDFDIIFEFSTLETNSFTWDVGNLPDGRYYLNLVAIDSENVETIKRSPTFVIQNKEPEEPQEPEEPSDAFVEITDILPQDGATLNLRKPEVVGKFRPSVNAEVDINSFKFFLNGEDKTSLCTVSILDFTCRVDQDLVNGTYEIKLSVSAAGGESREVTQSVNINAEDIVSFPQGESDNVNFLGILIPRSVVNLILILCGLTFLLLFIPWILIRIWKRDDVEEEEITTVTTDYTSSDPYSSFDNSYFITPTVDKPVVEEPVIKETTVAEQPKNAIEKEDQDIRAQIVADYSQPNYLVTEAPAPVVDVPKAPEVVETKPVETTETPVASVTEAPKEKSLDEKTEEEIMQDYYKYINPTNDQTFVEPTPTDEPTK